MKTKEILNYVLIFALITQITHAQSLFAEFSKETGLFATVISYIFAISLESSIYLFALRGRKQVAQFFGIVSFLINYFYYNPEPSATKNFLVPILLSVIIPVLIWFFTEEVEKEQKPKVGRPQGSTTIKEQPELSTIVVEKKPVGRPKKQVEVFDFEELGIN